MLVSLSIKNFALFEDDLLEFAPGLNALTGETGAGKSIVLDALGLALGRRADPGHVRAGAARLAVAAVFRLASPRLRALLKELGVESDEREDEVLLRREVDAAGKSRAFVNDRPVNLPTLSRVAELLIYIHGQHEHQLLLKPSEQRELVDAFGALAPAREKVAEAYAVWKTASAEREALSLSEQERAQRVDLYRYQKKELDAAAPKAGEEEELERVLPQLRNAEKLKTGVEDAINALKRQEGASSELARKALASVQALKNLGAPVEETVDLLNEAVIRLEEAAAQLDGFSGNIDLDPDKLENTLGRLDLFSKLKKKYGPTLADVVAYRERVAEELDRLENLEGKSLDMDRRLAEAEGSLAAQSRALSESRQAVAKKLGAAVNKEFRDVGLPHAEFDIEVALDEGKYTAAGADSIQFFFTPNPGEGRRPLAEVASGGELSRVMLAVKSVLAKTDAVPVLVFDEIDAGVGGALGAVLGKKLAKLGKTHQVICVTHLATIAACAGHHFAVEKEIHKDRTRTRAKALTPQERVVEIARLFGTTGEASDTGLRHARELLEASRT